MDTNNLGTERKEYLGTCIGGSLHGKSLTPNARTLEICTERDERIISFASTPSGETYILRYISCRDGRKIYFWVAKGIDLADFALDALYEKIANYRASTTKGGLV